MSEIICTEEHPLAMREEKFALNSDFALCFKVIDGLLVLEPRPFHLI